MVDMPTRDPWISDVRKCCGLPEILARDRCSERYEVLEVIAHGGMSEVFAAWDKRLRRRVALKRCRRSVKGPPFECLHFNPDPLVSAFAAEMHILSQLHHSSIIPLYDCGIDDGNYLFFTMPLLGGQTFLDVIEQVRSGTGEWSCGLALWTLLRICDALRYVHAKGIVHCDLKPANIAIGVTGETYLLDWGLARVLPKPEDPQRDMSPSSVCLSFLHGRKTTEEGASGRPDGLCGTPSYMPVEYVVRGSVSAQFDVYSFGAVLYHLLAGHAPYDEDPENTSIFDALLEGEPRALEAPSRSIDPQLIRICNGSMARRLEDRYPSMQAVRDELNRYIQHRCDRADRASGGASAAIRGWLRRRFVVQ